MMAQKDAQAQIAKSGYLQKMLHMAITARDDHRYSPIGGYSLSALARRILEASGYVEDAYDYRRACGLPLRNLGSIAGCLVASELGVKAYGNFK